MYNTIKSIIDSRQIDDLDSFKKQIKKQSFFGKITPEQEAELIREAEEATNGLGSKAQTIEAKVDWIEKILGQMQAKIDEIEAIVVQDADKPEKTLLDPTKLPCYANGQYAYNGDTFLWTDADKNTHVVLADPVKGCGNPDFVIVWDMATLPNYWTDITDQYDMSLLPE